MQEVEFNAIAYLAGYAAGKREGILQAAAQVDCGCPDRAEVLGYLTSGQARKAADACPCMSGNCYAICAHEIRELVKDEAA